MKKQQRSEGHCRKIIFTFPLLSRSEADRGPHLIFKLVLSLEWFVQCWTSISQCWPAFYPASPSLYDVPFTYNTIVPILLVKTALHPIYKCHIPFVIITWIDMPLYNPKSTLYHSSLVIQCKF